MKNLLLSIIGILAFIPQVHASELHPLEQWSILEKELLEVIRTGAPCGPDSIKTGFCRADHQEMPTREKAALSDLCRGQPASDLASLGDTAGDWQTRRLVSDELEAIFSTDPFGSNFSDKETWLGLFKVLHDRDQVLRFFNPTTEAANKNIPNYSKWIAICANARFSYKIAQDFLDSTNPATLASHEELAMYVWLLVQHSDFDPLYQLKISEYFGSVDTLHMQVHSAYLHDRAMVGLHKKQKFGTQLRCNKGTREPFPVADADGLDDRRIELGLLPMKQHLANFPRPCPT